MTSGQVARLFGVATETVIRWADEGKLAHFRTPGGQRRYRREDVETFLRVSGGEPPEPEAAVG